jgi:pimeloyl-ACP methyl ester carboxylesterase
MRTSSQLFRSWYMFLFQLPYLPELAGPARDARRFARQLVSSGMAADTARAYADRLAEPGAFAGGVNWYRGAALPSGIRRGSRVTVPTLFIWSSGDRFLSRKAAELTEHYVDGPYRVEEIAGADHWLPDNNAEQVVELLLPHLRQ